MKKITFVTGGHERYFPSIKKGIYRHNKKNQLYEVVGVALQTETNEPLVVYRPLYQNEYEIFARPYAMFIEKIVLGDKTVSRFEFVRPS